MFSHSTEVNTMTKSKQQKKQKSKVVVKVVREKTKKQKPRRQKGKRVPRGPMLSECAMKYKAAVARPFSVDAIGACLPFPPDRDSLKATGLTRFPLIADASGNAFCLFAPTIVNDKICAWINSTTGTIPVTVAVVDTPPANYAAYGMTGLPFSASAISGATIQGRIVSVGFRITYNGPVTAMSGLYFSYCDPQHGNLNLAAYNYAGLFSTLETKIKRVTADAFEQGFTIVNPAEQAYVGNKEYIGSAGTIGSDLVALYPWSGGQDINYKGPNTAGYLANGGAPIVFGVNGASAGSAYYVELVTHVEYTGKGASYGLTPSHNDHNAANVITAAADRSVGEFNSDPNKTWSNVLSSTVNRVLSETQTPMGKMATATVVKAARTWIGSRVRGAPRLQD